MPTFALILLQSVVEFSIDTGLQAYLMNFHVAKELAQSK